MSDYHRLLAQEDAEARGGYNFDPRIAYHTQTRVLREHLVPAVSGGQGAALNDPGSFAREPEGSRSDAQTVQAPPKTVIEKRYIIVDCAQRDWTVYPNAYSNLTFAFGGQGNTKTPVPVYTNNPTYPSFALPPTYASNFTPLPGSANVRGFSYIDPKTGLQVDLSAYNSSLPKGQFVAFDSSINNTAGSGDAFGTALTPSNVTALRLVRAILPQTPFFSYPTDPIFASDASDAKAAATATPYNTFGTYPYILFYLNEFRGNYYGPTEQARRAFSVLTQCNRMQLDFTLTNGPQYFDYTPWNQEALRFQSPLTSLQKLQITVTDPAGTPFGSNQPDNLQIDSIRLATTVTPSTNTVYISSITVSGTSAIYAVQGSTWSSNYDGYTVVITGASHVENNGSFRTLSGTASNFSVTNTVAVAETDSPAQASVTSGSNVVVSRATLICTTPAYKRFPETQLREGDRVSFYKPILNAMFNSPALSNATTANASKKQFINELLDKTFPVLAVRTYKWDPSLNTYVPDPTANAASLTDSRIDYFNAFFIPNFTNLLPNGTLEDIYSNAVDTSLNNYSILDVQNLLGVGQVLPLLNVTQQPVYTFELEVATPDTSKIGGQLVN